MHTRFLTVSMVVAGIALAGCNNRQYENQNDQVTTAPPQQEEPMAEPGYEPPQPTDQAQQPGEELMIGDVMRSPNEWTGRNISGKATVVDVPSENGFWVEAGGQRMFAILSTGMGEEPIVLQPGQTVNIADATVRDSIFLTTMPGELDEQTRQLAQGQPVFLVVDQEDIRIEGEGTMPPTEQPSEPMDPMDPEQPEEPGEQPPPIR